MIRCVSSVACPPLRRFGKAGAALAGPLAGLLPALLAALLPALLLVSSPPPARAQSSSWWAGGASAYPRRAMRPQRKLLSRRAREADDQTQSRHKGKGTGSVEAKPTGPLFAILSLSDQHISVYNSSGLVTRSKVSTGMPGHRTPMGIFTIIGRERYHSSNIYSGAPMPFMQRITWSGVAMHLGVVPGYPASHGCIRLPAGSAERLWGLTKIGERVVISPHAVAPSAFSHPLLPVPGLQPAPAAPVENAQLKVTEVAAAGNAPLALEPPKLLNPIDYALALKRRAAAEIASLTRALQEPPQRKDAISETLRRALFEVRAAETARAQAEAKLAARMETLATKRDTRERERADAARIAAAAHLAEATKKLEAALENGAFASPEGHEALDAERKLMELRLALAKAQSTAKSAERRLSPVSILVSKKDKKIYVRQGLAPLLEVPAVIRDPQTPLGTHVYIATSHSDGASLGWTVVSMQSASRTAQETSQRRERKVGGQAKDEVERSPAPSSAAQALERLEFPPAVAALAAERLWTGSSLIITDEALSDETSDVGTDLVVTLR